MVVRSHMFRFVLVLLIIAMPVAVFGGGVGKATGGGSSIQWTLSVSGHDKVVLSISGPDGEVYTAEYPNGKAVNFNLKDLPSVEDGAYTWQLTAYPKIAPGLQKQLEAARKSGDELAARKLMRANGLGQPATETGGFTVANGSIVSTAGSEEGSNARFGGVATNGIATGVPNVGGSPARPGTPATLDQVIPDDLIVQGSGCFGFDCVNNESFGFDTIRLKENNLRIKAEDTSVGSFPTNDWQLTFNDSASGGSSKFSVEDITGSKVPLTITAGAATNSIFADSTGRIGFRTSTPVLDLHVSTTNTPAIRLEQTSGGGFTAQTWDIAGNEANFFVRDVTAGSRLPFRIRPGAPTSSLDIAADGQVGVGTASPDVLLDVAGSGAQFITVEDIDATPHFTWIYNGGANDMSAIGWDSPNDMRFGTSTSNAGASFVERVRIQADGDVGIKCNNPTFDLVIASGTGANCTNPASNINAGDSGITVTSSRTYKENLEPIAVPDILEKVSSVGVFKYDFIDGPKDKIGLIAEDFHTVFGRGSEKLINTGEVQMALWMAVQQLTAQNKELKDRLNALESKVEPKQ